MRRDSLVSAYDADPLASVRMEAMADLAFGSLTADMSQVEGGHLALLTNEALELDLNDPLQRQFGDYELLEQIGEGGMGVVYRAQQRSLDREVAVKLLAAGPWASKTFIERFRLEAQNAARMQHPNIVAIYDVGSADEMHFFSMRLVRGGSLAGLLRRDGKLLPRQAAALVRTIAEAVDYAHRLGVLHLDLKPANVLVDEDGVPHVADFGLARRLDTSLAADNDEISGTPSYMAPEQAQIRFQRLTVATDIWGLGAILHELLTGRPPFLAASPQATLELVRNSELADMRALQADLPEDLIAIVRMCLQHDVAARYANARALADDLGRFLEGRIVRARPLGVAQRTWRWAKRQPYLATLALLFALSLLVGVGGITTQWQRAEHNARDAETSATLANERLWQARIDQAADALHDGRTYDALPGLAANISEREALGLDAQEDRVRIAGVERSAPRLVNVLTLGTWVTGVAISPDGQTIAVADGNKSMHLLDAKSGNELWKTSFVGATHFLLSGDENSVRLDQLHFTPNGRRIIGAAYIGVPDVMTSYGRDEVAFDANDGHLIQPSKQILPDVVDATFSKPDGDYAISRTSDGRARLVRTAGWQAITPSAPFDPIAAWVVGHDASSIAVGDQTLRRLSVLDPHTLQPLWRFDFPAPQAFSAWSSSPVGNTLLVGHLDGQTEIIDTSNGVRQPLAPTLSGRVDAVAYSNDGRWIGAISESGEVVVWDSASHALISTPMFISVHGRSQLALDAKAKTVLAVSGNWTASLWYLPDVDSPPLRLSALFPFAMRGLPLRPFSYDADHGLVAMDGGQGDIRLWRLQPPPELGMLASRVPPQSLRVADTLIDAEDNRLRLFDLSSGRYRSWTQSLPGPIAYAELSDDGTTVAASTETSLFVFDANTGTARHPPFEFPNDPARWMLTPDGHGALIFFAEYADGANRETLQRLDLSSGVLSAAQPVDPSSQFRFMPGGDRLLSWSDDTVQLRNANSLNVVWQTRPLSELLNKQALSADIKADVSIVDASPSPDGAQIDVFTTGETTAVDVLQKFSSGWMSNLGSGRMWRLNARDGTIISDPVVYTHGGGQQFVHVPGTDTYVISRLEGMEWWSEKKGANFKPSRTGVETGELVLSPNSGILARDTVDGIELTSTKTQRWLSPPLPIPLSDAESQGNQLAFSGDGQRLIARSRFANWLAWDVSADARPASDIARDAALSRDSPTVEKDNLLPPLSAADLALLRAADPGSPDLDTRAARPLKLSAPLTDRLSSIAVDLSDVPNKRPFNTFSGSEAQELTPGPHQFFGVEYDMHDCITLASKHSGSDAGAGNSLTQVSGIHLPLARVSALDLIVGASGKLMDRRVHPYAYVSLHYRDGSQERLPILYRRDIFESWNDVEGVDGETWARIAWRARGQQHGTPTNLFAVRLVNPKPQRDIADIALEAVDEAWSSPRFCAITVEPIVGDKQ